VEGKFAQFSLRVTSLGNAIVHELSVSGRPDHPVTMFYLDGDRLLLTHYCDAGNRPRMVGKVSPDGKTLEFDFLDLSGGNKYGHMHHAVFSFIDANHHIEDWTWMGPGEKPTRAHFDLQRTNGGSSTTSEWDDLENLMGREWNDSQPIYRQLRKRVVAMILEGVLKEGDPLPSVRNVAAEYRAIRSRFWKPINN
jgi:hypothetical protein